MRGSVNPHRLCNMAFDILLPYEKEQETDLTFEDLKPGTIRKMLHHFKNTTSIMDTSKAKYVKEFQKLLNFLYIDIDSPETLK